MPLRFCIIFSLLLCFCVIIVPASGQDGTKIKILDMTLDKGTVIQMLQRGEVGLIESNEDGSLKQATAITLLDHPVSEVWEFLLDFDNYTKYFNNLKRCERLGRFKNQYKVYFELKVPLTSLKYTLLFKAEPMHSLRGEWIDGDLKGGYYNYSLYPGEDLNTTILVYNLYSPVKEQSWIVRVIISSNPSMEHGLNVGAALLTLRDIRLGLRKKASLEAEGR